MHNLTHTDTRNSKLSAIIKLGITLSLLIFLSIHTFMAFRTPTYWKSMLSRLGVGGGRSTFATSTTPKMKAYAPALDHGPVEDALPTVRFDFVPVYVAMGMIATSVSLGLYTALHQLKYAPNVRVRKSLRETIPEVVSPDLVVDEGDKFIKKSLLRKVAHIPETGDPIVPDHVHREILSRPPPRAETLKEVGVDPKTN